MDRALTVYGRKLSLWPLVLLAGLVFLALLLLLMPQSEAFPLAVYVPLVLLLAAVLYRVGIHTVDPEFPPPVFWLAFVVRLISSTVYYWVVYGVYGRGDANEYYLQGQYVARLLSQFDFSILGSYTFGGQGTSNMVYLTGFLYTLLPPSMPGASLLFATLAFTGSVFFYRAFRVAFPQQRPHLYRIVTFFLPSLLFWPATLGKEAWTYFGSGLAAYGLAGFFQRSRPRALVWAVAGLLAVALVRPHFAILMIIAAGAATLLVYRPTSAGRTVAWLIALGLLIAVGVFLLPRASENVGLDAVSEPTLEAVTGHYEDLQERTSIGGSSFVPPAIVSLVGPVFAAATVLFRPFPWEAHNAQMMISAIESMAWLGLMIWQRRTLRNRLRSLTSQPFVAFALVYCVLLIVALGAIGNFGILVRQRVALLSFFWMLFA
jgi:hypothetical protein